MATTYTSYFDKLPKIKYDINRALINPKYETVTNIFFRIKIMQEALSNISSYFVVELSDGDTPEIMAEKVYGDPGAGWMILLANQIIDPQWDWPLDYDAFRQYIIGKYGSIEHAKITPHHYEMVIQKTIQPDNITTERRYVVNAAKLTDNMPNVPYNYYFPQAITDDLLTDSESITADSGYYTADIGIAVQDNTEPGIEPGSLAFTQSVSTYEIEGKTVTEVIFGEEIMMFDYENRLNENKRFVKIIKKEYYPQIMREFETLTFFESPYRRRVR